MRPAVAFVRTTTLPSTVILREKSLESQALCATKNKTLRIKDATSALFFRQCQHATCGGLRTELFFSCGHAMYLKKRRITQLIDATSALKMSYEASESCNTHQHEETQSKTSSKTDSLKLALQLAGTNVDTKSFGTRRVVASSLRNEKSLIVPLLLYWHPDADLATLSVHSKVVRKAEPAGLLNNLRHSLFGGSRNANNDRETCAFIKLLVQPERALSY